MNFVILGAVLIQWFISTKSRLWGAIVGLLITLGIGVWGLGLYADGYAVSLFGLKLSEGIFYLFIAAWIVYDIVMIVQAKNASSDIVLAEETKIYQEPDLNAPVVHTAQKGDRLDLHSSVKNVRGTQWMQVKTADGTRQFILGDTPLLRYFNLTQKETKVYAQPDLNSEVLEVINGKQQIELGRTQKIDNKVWVKATTRQTPEGYILGNTKGNVVKR